MAASARTATWTPAWTRVATVVLDTAHEHDGPSLDDSPPVKANEASEKDEEGVDNCEHDDELGLLGVSLLSELLLELAVVLAGCILLLLREVPLVITAILV